MFFNLFVIFLMKCNKSYYINQEVIYYYVCGFVALWLCARLGYCSLLVESCTGASTVPCRPP